MHRKPYFRAPSMLSMYQQITIKTLKHQGNTNLAIARIMDVHRNTVSNVLKRPEIVEKQMRNKPSSFSAYHTHILELTRKGFTKLKIWQTLKDEYALTPTYSAFCKYTQDHLKKVQPAFIVQSTAPGEEAEVDFGFGGLVPTPSGKYLKVWFFIMTLSYSRLAYYAAVTDQSTPSFIRCHQEAFDSFGGVPKTVKVDNLKAAILTNTRHDLEVTRDYLEFSHFFTFIIKPCSPFEPNQKGKVENGVGYVKKNFLPGRTFTDLSDFTRQLRDWMIHTANVRTHGTTKKIPKDVFEQEEKIYLQPLPENPYHLTIPLIRKVKLNCHINYLNNYYSVPAKYVGEMVEARADNNLLTIFFNHTNIAEHLIATGEGNYITNPTHYPPDRVYSQTTFQTKYEDKMKAMGPAAHEFFKSLITRDHLWVRVVKKLLGLAKDYGNGKVNLALARALAYGAYKPSAIERILEGHLETTEIEPKLVSPTTNPPATIPEQHTTPTEPYTRELTYYGGIGSKKETKPEENGTEKAADKQV